MIRKPTQDVRRESAVVTAVRTAAFGSVSMARSGTYVVRGVFCWALAALWGFAALTGGVLGGSLPTLIGVGAMSAGMAWCGKRMFAKAFGRS